MASKMKKAMKQMAREQAKRDKKYAPKTEQKSSTEVLGMKSILDYNKERTGDKLRKQLTYGWIFEKFWEKIILVALGILGMWKILEFII